MFKVSVLIGLYTFWFLAVSTEVVAGEQQTLIFAVNSPGTRPYAYFDPDSQSYQGLVRDFFEYTARKGLLSAKFVDSHRTRSEQFLSDGKVDMLLANPNWLKQPEDFIVSISIMPHRSFLYSLTAFPADFSVANIANNRICTRSGFIYTGLEALFKSKTLLRVDSSSQATMAAMLVKQRCDYAVMNDYNAGSIFSDEKFCDIAVYQSPSPSSSVDLALIMRREMAGLKKLIDEQLQIYISSGKFDTSLTIHASARHFPKLATCAKARHSD